MCSKRAEITGVNGASAACQTAGLSLRLPGEKRASSTRTAIKAHGEIILGSGVLGG